MMAIFAMRGSIDINGKFYTVDARFKSENHLDKCFKLILNSEKLFDYLNLNFRELQNQFVREVHKRDTQIRVDLGYFYTFNRTMHLINKYRANVLDYQADNGKITPPKIGTIKNCSSFIDRISFYKNSILKRKLTNANIEYLRNQLFDSKNNKFITRKQRIKIFIQETTDDKCVGCCDKYDIKDRSFIMPNNNNHWYLEINHIIPFANSPQEIDVSENLVKLCPVCHRALTPGRAKIDLQKHIIRQMINSRTDVLDYIIKISKNSNKDEQVKYVLNLLK